jgi:nucleoside-diphosphate-sugar epimerase
MPTVLITGACGGIGSKLVPFLVSKGLKIIALDDLSSGTWNNLSPDLPITKLTVDITQKDELKRLIEELEFEFCILTKQWKLTF